MIIETELWVYVGSFYYSIYFCICLRFSEVIYIYIYIYIYFILGKSLASTIGEIIKHWLELKIVLSIESEL